MTKEGSAIAKGLREKCAVFGVYGKDADAAQLAYYGLYSLQHRGQESSGIVTSDGRQIYSHMGSGLVAHVYQQDDLALLHGNMGIGHNRYSTSGGGKDEHNQPVVLTETGLAFAHNGNLPSTMALEEFLDGHGVERAGANDSEMMTAAINYHIQTGCNLPEAVSRAYPLFTGAFSCVALHEGCLVAFRDTCGIRPLALGTIEDGFAVASETCAFDTIGAAFLREVRPGEMVIIDKHGLRSRQLAEGREQLDIFEFIYFARPDSLLAGRRVYSVRRNFGIQLAREHPLQADVVIPMPDSGIPAAVGYAQATGTPFENGLIKNRYIHRTFIRPNAHLRQHDLRMKLNPMPELIMGKRVVVVDDSIVRGTTTKKVVAMLYGAGAKTVAVLSSSPPVKYPDFYGIDTPRQTELIAARLPIEEIAEEIGCDYLGYLSHGGMIAATGLPASRFSTACFSGVYPVDIRERAAEIRQVQ